MSSLSINHFVIGSQSLQYKFFLSVFLQIILKMFVFCKQVFFKWLQTANVFVKILIMPNIRSAEKSFAMILRLEMISSAAFNERKNIIFYEQNSELTKNNTCNNFFYTKIFSYYCIVSNFWKLDFHKSWLIFSGKILSTTLLFLILNIVFNGWNR